MDLGLPSNPSKSMLFFLFVDVGGIARVSCAGADHAVSSILNAEGQGDVVLRVWFAIVLCAPLAGGARLFPSPVKRMMCFAHFFRDSLHRAGFCESRGILRPIGLFELSAQHFVSSQSRQKTYERHTTYIQPIGCVGGGRTRGYQSHSPMEIRICRRHTVDIQ